MFMQINRIFCFGCSFTHYFWPCYPEIIRRDIGIPVYNYARPGMGNVGIMHRIIEADLRHKFTDDDVIITQWSKWNREDRYLDDGWLSLGGLPDRNGFYDDAFMRKYWSEKNDIIKNATAIITANKLYDCINLTISPFPQLEAEELEFYYDHLPAAADVSHGLNNSHFDGKFMEDDHPDVKAHLEIVQQIIYPALGLEINESTLSHVDIIFEALKQEVDGVLSGQTDMSKVFNVWEAHGWGKPEDMKLFERIVKRFSDKKFKLRW